MSTRMPPRGRTPQKPPYKPPAAREDHTAPAAPEKERRRRGFDIVIVLVLVALVAVAIKEFSSPQAVINNAIPTANPYGKTAKPGKTGATAAPSGAPIKDVPIITEIMSSNKGSITAADGNYYDWIELYNPTGKTINLAGFALSDNLKKPAKCVLPTWTLDPGKYAIIYADGGKSTATELHVTFKLKSSGTALLLVDPNGNQVQTIACPALETDHSYAMDASDSKKWVDTDKYTPGFPNTTEGYGAYEQTRRATAPIGINEVMPGNTLTIKDEDGDYSDWIELYNPTDKAVDLTGWGLSNKESVPKRWVFPKTTLDPGKYIVIFASGKNRAVTGKELHTDFRLNAFQDTVILSNLRGQIVSEVQINNLKPDSSFALVPGTDKWQVFTQPTPGYPNNEQGWNALQPKLYNGDTNEPVVINEMMSSNATTIKDQFNEYPDWIELYNRSDKSVDLKGYGLTNKSDELGRWKFPDISLQPGAYLTVFASGRNLADANAVSSKELHTDFKLGGNGGVIALTAPDGHLADKCFAPPLRVGDSYGRAQQGALFNYITDPTPGAANTNGYPGQAPDPHFSINAGMYDSEQKVDLVDDDKDATIYYTLDGSMPSKSSTQYSGTIDMPKTTVIRAIAYHDGYLASNAVCSTYLIKEGITIPVISVVTDPGLMFNPTIGIYEKGPDAKSAYPYVGANFWKKTEIPAHLELLETDGTIGISQDIGLRIFGQYSRGDAYKGFALIARSKYGKSSLDYQIFPDQQYTSYKSVVLKPGGQDVKRTGMRDVLVGSLVRDTVNTDSSGGPSVYVQDYRTAVLFVNGEFWGVTQIREKINTHTIAQHYHVDESKLDILEGNGNIVKAGSSKDFMDLIKYVKEHDLSNEDNYNYVASKMDIDSYIDWFTNEICSGNSDMANIRLWKTQTPDGKWRWIYYDFCWAFNDYTRSDLSLDLTGPHTGASNNRALVNALLKNPGFKEKFIQQLAYNIKVTFSPTAVSARIDEISAQMKPYMDREDAKWGYKNWDKQVQTLRDYGQNHPDKLKQQMKNYFNLSDAQMQQLFGSN